MVFACKAHLTLVQKEWKDSPLPLIYPSLMCNKPPNTPMCTIICAVSNFTSDLTPNLALNLGGKHAFNRNSTLEWEVGDIITVPSVYRIWEAEGTLQVSLYTDLGAGEAFLQLDTELEASRDVSTVPSVHCIGRAGMSTIPTVH